MMDYGELICLCEDILWVVRGVKVKGNASKFIGAQVCVVGCFRCDTSSYCTGVLRTGHQSIVGQQ